MIGPKNGLKMPFYPIVSRKFTVFSLVGKIPPAILLADQKCMKNIHCACSMNIGPILWSTLFEATIIYGHMDIWTDQRGSPTQSRDTQWRTASLRIWWMIAEVVLNDDMLLPAEMAEMVKILKMAEIGSSSTPHCQWLEKPVGKNTNVSN